jgi:hypothetical protein
MPNPNAVVATTFQFDPPLEGRSPEEAVQATGGLTVDIGADRRVRLDPADDRAAGFVRVLDGLAALGRPAYIELNSDTQTIDRLLIPTIGHVTSIQIAPDSGGAFEVQLDTSHARHRLPAGTDDAPELERTLRQAFDTGRPILLVEDFEGAIIDVREFEPGPDDGPLPPFPKPGGPVPPTPEEPWWKPWLHWPYLLWIKIKWWILYPFWWYRCPTATQAQQIFDAMAATSCDPLTVQPPCIPFLYPDNGCWARAHEMCRLIGLMGRSPRKVWIYGYLNVTSANKPGCLVQWAWHVAPTLCVRRRPWKTRRVVIDPSLFTTPVSEAQWKAIAGDPNATLINTDATVYLRPPFSPPTDPSYAQTLIDLATYRLSLYNRSLQFGPPPYVCP